MGENNFTLFACPFFPHSSDVALKPIDSRPPCFRGWAFLSCLWSGGGSSPLRLRWTSAMHTGLHPFFSSWNRPRRCGIPMMSRQRPLVLSWNKQLQGSSLQVQRISQTDRRHSVGPQRPAGGTLPTRRMSAPWSGPKTLQKVLFKLVSGQMVVMIQNVRESQKHRHLQEIKKNQSTMHQQSH